MALIRADGHIPSVAEVAVRSKVSRATAYRCFGSRSALITAVVEASLGPLRNLSPDDLDGRERVRELFAETFPRFKEFEPQLRAAALLALEQWGLERAGLLEEVPYRRGHRIRILAHAIAPLDLPPTLRDRLHRALSVVYGIEPVVILKDIWGLPDREVERIATWMADALVDAALRQARAMRESRPPAAKGAARAATTGGRARATRAHGQADPDPVAAGLPGARRPGNAAAARKARAAGARAVEATAAPGALRAARR
jgi:AcrR family transcriptional regulator